MTGLAHSPVHAAYALRRSPALTCCVRAACLSLSGKAQVDFMTANVTLDDCVLVHLWDMELNMSRCRQSTADRGASRPVETVLNVLDLDGIGTQTYGLLPYLKAIARIDEDNYPETLGATLVLNAPWIFGALWKIIKGFLDPVVAAKVIVLDGDWKKTLLDTYIDADALPAEYGGKCNCAGGCIPMYKAEDIKASCVLHRSSDVFASPLPRADRATSPSPSLSVTACPCTCTESTSLRRGST
jgi:hypothetical protein